MKPSKTTTPDFIQIWHTFEEWSALGYRIVKGAKSCQRREGVPVFGSTQVYKPGFAYRESPDDVFDIRQQAGIGEP